MTIQFYFEIEGKRFILPVNPATISIQSKSNNQVAEVVKLGEINQLGAKTLADFAFESIFPKNRKASYVNQKSTNLKPLDWVKTIQKAKDNNQRVRVIGTDLGINVLSAIESFTWGFEDSTGDVTYAISFKEYREFKAKYVQTVAKKVSTARQQPVRPKPATNKPITIGCEVICNGRLHRDSYGTGPGQTEKNARRKVNFIAKGRKCPYHVTTTGGGWRGWVTVGSVKRV